MLIGATGAFIGLATTTDNCLKYYKELMSVTYEDFLIDEQKNIIFKGLFKNNIPQSGRFYFENKYYDV
jgi:hypothetical protein